MKSYPLTAHQVFFEDQVYLRQIVPHMSPYVFWYTVDNDVDGFRLITDDAMNEKLNKAWKESQ